MFKAHKSKDYNGIIRHLFWGNSSTATAIDQALFISLLCIENQKSPLIVIIL